MIGKTLSHYRIIEKLGQGGMGEVFLAEDSHLNRRVAIKVLPDAFASAPERLARFDREAKLLASLSHQNIASIYGLEKTDGSPFLVMELVEGETLAQHVANRPLPMDEAVEVCRQIAQGLEAAHEKGIIHRDLKPANIKITPEGKVKILDFGLAKAFQEESAATDLSHSPTITEAMTRVGVILGTAAYMSPEQAKGKTVDKRTDIWAFGCVLYECLTGKRAFAGDDVTDLIVAVMAKGPDWTLLPPATPPRMVELLKRCLKKDPRERLRDIGDARLEIEETIARGSLDASAGESAASSARVVGATRREKLAWALAAVLTLVGAAGWVLFGLWPRTRPPEMRPLRVSIVHTEGSDVGAPAISPDGRRVAYGARRLDGMPVLWVRDLASGEARSLTGTEGAALPFWSPDSHDLGFFAGGSLKRVSGDGGPVQGITEKVAGRSGTWAPDGTIIFSPGDHPLFRVSAAGGAVTPVTKLQSVDWAHFWPTFLPDGRRFLFTAKLWTRTAEASEQGIYLGSLDKPEIQRLLPDLSSAVYSPPGYLVFVRDGTLTAAPFDLATGRVSGPPSPIGGTVAVENTYYFSGISAAANGTLAVRPPPALALIGDLASGTFNAELRFVDRRSIGSRVGTAQPFSYRMALHPDGRRVAAQIVDPRTSTGDLWVVDLQSDNKTPLTTARGYTGAPVWSPDGTRLAYAYQPPGQMDDVYIKDFRTGQATPVIESPAVFEHPLAWSHDGTYLLVLARDEKGASNLSRWAFGSRTLTRFVGSKVDEAAFSPDDRYVAFSSLESGRTEVYVTTFPGRRQTWPLTTEGGRVLSWRADGREILVATLSGHIAAYPVSTEGGFSAGPPTVLVRDVGFAAPYSTATRDHSHILIRVSPDAAKDKGEIRLLFGWQDALRNR